MNRNHLNLFFFVTWIVLLCYPFNVSVFVWTKSSYATWNSFCFQNFFSTLNFAGFQISNKYFIWLKLSDIFLSIEQQRRQTCNTSHESFPTSFHDFSFTCSLLAGFDLCYSCTFFYHLITVHFESNTKLFVLISLHRFSIHEKTIKIH